MFKLGENLSFKINPTMTTTLFLKNHLKYFIFFNLSPHMLLFHSGLLNRLNDIETERVLMAVYFFERKHDMKSMIHNLHLGRNKKGELLIVYPKGMKVINEQSYVWLKKINPSFNLIL